MLFCVAVSFSIYSQNPLVNHNWSSSDGGGTTAIITANNPFGDSAQMLEATGNTSWSGFRLNNISVDHSTTYRISFWAKLDDVTNPSHFYSDIYSRDSNDNAIHGMLKSDGSSANHKYLMGTWGAPFLPQANNWYLIVGFIKGSSDSNSYQGSIYDINGNVVGNDFISRIILGTLPSKSIKLDLSLFINSAQQLRTRPIFMTQE